MTQPILYKGNETDFTTYGLGILSDEVETLVTEERNGQFYMTMKYPVEGRHFKQLRLERIIKTDASLKQKNQRFKIVRITKPAKGFITVYAEHVSNLAADYQLKPDVNYIGTAIDALRMWDWAIATPKNPFTYHSDIQTRGSGTWPVDKLDNARRALGGIEGSILDTYGGEYKFDNYHIMLYKDRGKDNGIPIMYGKNLIDLEQEEEIASVYNSVYPYAFHKPEGADEQQLITLPEYYLDSFPESAGVNRKIIKKDFSGEEVQSVADLRDATNRFIIDNDIGSPKVNLKVAFVDLANTLDYKDRALLENIELCDWVTVYFQRLGVEQRAKVVKTVYNPTISQYKEIEVGEARMTFTETIDKTTDSKIEDVEQQLNIIQIAANGKNKIFRGPTKPLTGMAKGDLWYKPVGDGEVEVYQFDGDSWGLIISSGMSKVVEDALTEAEKKIQDARDHADTIEKDANSILKGLGVRDLGETHYETVEGVKRAVTNRIDGLGLDITEFSGSLNARLDDIMGNIDGFEGEFSNFADKVYVDSQVDRTKGEITNIIAGVKENPAENTTWYNAMKSTMDGNVSEIARVKETAGTLTFNYNQVKETADLFTRTLGTSETGVADSVSRIVQSSDIIQSEIGKYNSTPNIMGSMSRRSLGRALSYFRTEVPYKKTEPYTVLVSTTNPNASNLTLGGTAKVTEVLPLGEKEGHYQYRVLASQLSVIDNDEITIDSRRVVGGLPSFKIESVNQVDATGIHSMVTQLNNSWAVGIKSDGDLISAINASEEGVYVKGEYITLDGDTNVAGNFKVTGDMLAESATIENLKGQTLNFAEINTVNFNFDNASGSGVNLSGIIDATGGSIGSWTLDRGVMHGLVNGLHTTLKATGNVALATGSPNPYSTTDAALQIWHDGTIRFGNSSTRIYADSRNILTMESTSWMYLKPSNTVFVEGRVLPWADNTGSVGSHDYEWYSIHGKAHRVHGVGVMQRGTADTDGKNSLEIYTNQSLLLKTANRMIYGQGSFLPYYASNTYTLGSADYRWQGVYLTAQPNVSSDMRDKELIQEIPQGLIDNLKEIKPKMYQQNDQWHFGYIAQDVERAIYKYTTSMKTWSSMAEMNEYARSFAMLHKDESKLSLLYGEIAVIKEAEMTDRMNKLEERLEALENE